MTSRQNTNPTALSPAPGSVWVRPRPRHGGPATEPPPCTLLRHADLAGRGLCCSRGLGCPPPPSSTWLSTPYSLRPMAKLLLRDTPAPQAQRSQASSATAARGTYFYFSASTASDRDFLSRWIMSDLKIPFIAYSHAYLQLLTWLLCTQWESIKFA